MNPVDILLIAALAVIVGFAVLQSVRLHKKGRSCCCGSSGCSGSCAGCGTSCPSKPADRQKNKP